jgi:hypothetical protein
MPANRGFRLIAILAIALLLLIPNYTMATKKSSVIPTEKSVIWQDPGDISSRNLYFAQGSEARAPKGDFKIIEAKKNGHQVNLILIDEQEEKWFAKVGQEAQSETVATHLLWSVGYFTDETYFVPELSISNINQALQQYDSLESEYFNKNNHLIDVRMEREDQHAVAWEWNWFENPFVGTREFNGLRAMMALINNWDLKNSNNKISFDEKSNRYYYAVHDIGACFGKTGGLGSRTVGEPKDYAEAIFLKNYDADYVDLIMDSKPPAILAINPSYWEKRTKMSKITRQIPRADARWIGELLGKLSEEQLADAFRAANYSPEEIRQYTEALRFRITLLEAL